MSSVIQYPAIIIGAGGQYLGPGPQGQADPVLAWFLTDNLSAQWFQSGSSWGFWDEAAGLYRIHLPSLDPNGTPVELVATFDGRLGANPINGTLAVNLFTAADPGNGFDLTLADYDPTQDLTDQAGDGGGVWTAWVSALDNLGPPGSWSLTNSPGSTETRWTFQETAAGLLSQDNAWSGRQVFENAGGIGFSDVPGGTEWGGITVNGGAYGRMYISAGGVTQLVLRKDGESQLLNANNQMTWGATSAYPSIRQVGLSSFIISSDVGVDVMKKDLATKAPISCGTIDAGDLEATTDGAVLMTLRKTGGNGMAMEVRRRSGASFDMGTGSYITIGRDGFPTGQMGISGNANFGIRGVDGFGVEVTGRVHTDSLGASVNLLAYTEPNDPALTPILVVGLGTTSTTVTQRDLQVFSGLRTQFSFGIRAANLPEAAAGLVAGDIWNNGGVLNIVPNVVAAQAGPEPKVIPGPSDTPGRLLAVLVMSLTRHQTLDLREITEPTEVLLDPGPARAGTVLMEFGPAAPPITWRGPDGSRVLYLGTEPAWDLMDYRIVLVRWRWDGLRLFLEATLPTAAQF